KESESAFVVDPERMQAPIESFNSFTAPKGVTDTAAAKTVRVREGLRAFLRKLGPEAVPGAKSLVESALRATWPLVRHFECVERLKRQAKVGCARPAKKLPPHARGLRPGELRYSIARAPDEHESAYDFPLEPAGGPSAAPLPSERRAFPDEYE